MIVMHYGIVILKKILELFLINNGGGNIFKFIPGPNTTNAVTYFETPHQLSAKQLCEMYTIEYIVAQTENELKNSLEVFYDVNNKVKLLEIKTSNMNSDTILRAYFESLTVDY